MKLIDSKKNYDRFHRRTLRKINRLYKVIYSRTIKCSVLPNQINEAFAYITLSEDIEKAYNKFKKSINES